MKTFDEVKAKFQLPIWYTDNVHAELVLVLEASNKLDACKFLRTYSNEYPEDSTNNLSLRTCIDLSEFILSGKPKSVKPVLVTINEDDDLITKVADLINDEIQDNYDLTGLCSLLKHVPENVLRDYLENN